MKAKVEAFTAAKEAYEAAARAAGGHPPGGTTAPGGGVRLAGFP